MTTVPRRVILDPATPREARIAAQRLVRALELRATTTSEESEGWLRTFVWTTNEADSAELVKLLANRHTHAKYSVVHDYSGTGPSDYVIINWRELS